MNSFLKFMPIFKKIKSFFGRIKERVTVIDPSLHTPAHKKWHTVAKGLQEQYGYSYKKAHKEATILLGFRKQMKELTDKGFTEKEASKLTKKILKTERAKITDIDKKILTVAET